MITDVYCICLLFLYISMDMISLHAPPDSPVQYILCYHALSTNSSVSVWDLNGGTEPRSLYFGAKTSCNNSLSTRNSAVHFQYAQRNPQRPGFLLPLHVLHEFANSRLFSRQLVESLGTDRFPVYSTQPRQRCFDLPQEAATVILPNPYQ